MQYLSEGPRTGVAQAILDRLLQSLLDGASDANRDAWLRLLDQAALLRQSGDWGAVDRWSDDAQRLGWSLAAHGVSGAFHGRAPRDAATALLAWKPPAAGVL